MEKLTERDEYGNADIVGVDSGELQLNLEFEEFNLVTGALNRLAEYEDTGLTPEEIEDLKRKYQEDEHEFCGQYGTDDCQFQYILEKIKQERDYWKKEALKWAGELGEQKIERGK